MQESKLDVARKLALIEALETIDELRAYRDEAVRRGITSEEARALDRIERKLKRRRRP